MKKIPDNQITIYQSPDGGVNIEVMYANENVWLTQKVRQLQKLQSETATNLTAMEQSILHKAFQGEL